MAAVVLGVPLVTLELGFQHSSSLRPWAVLFSHRISAWRVIELCSTKAHADAAYVGR